MTYPPIRAGLVPALIAILALPIILLPQEKRTLAVLDFDSFGISAPEVAALTNRLRTNMTQLDVYRIIERGLMQQIMVEQDFQLTGCTSDECAVEVGQLLGAQLMLAGSIGRVGNTWTVEMRVIDVETGAVVKSTSYDTQGTIDVVLTEGMSAAARKISGVEIADAAPATVGFTIRPAVLSVSVNPEQGIIFVDDIDRGAGQIKGLELAPGSHNVTARLDRYHTIDTTLSLEAGERNRVALTLQPMNGYLAFDGDAGARIKIGGKTMAKTPTENILIQMGTYPVAISKPAHYTFTANPTVLYDHITTVDYTLKLKPRAPALLLSLILPGSGQLYHGYGKGWLFSAVSVGLGYLGYAAHLDFVDQNDLYLTRLADYDNETNIGAAAEKRVVVQETFDLLKEYEARRNLMFGGLGGVWLVNVVDIVF
ncbi:MAG: PEGA domain-containing protein [Proteobacteria bacterium]|nr:PEGA domain-containing protein [Pseudomonadota bacterium]